MNAVSKLRGLVARSLLFVAPAAILTACPQDAEPPPSTPSDAGDGEGGVADASDASDASDAGDGGGPTGKYTATITTTQWSFMQPSAPKYVQHVELASFVVTEPSKPSGCITTTDGACKAVECFYDGGPSVDAGDDAYLSAGTVTIEGGATTVPLTRDMGGTYGAVGGTTLWSGGEQLRAKTTGDATGVATPLDVGVTAPHQVTVTSPALAPPASVIVDRNQPFAMAWTGGMAGTVRVSLTALSGTQKVTVTCDFTASAGNGAVSLPVLARLPQSVDGGLGTKTLSVVSLSKTEVLVGDVATSFVAQTNAVTPSGLNATTTIWVQ